jgi:hypothetical protein
MPTYEPLISSIVQSKYGYWIVTISVAPGLNLPVMVCKLGISPSEAGALALCAVPSSPPPARYA